MQAWVTAIRHWQDLPLVQRRAEEWRRIPRHVARSMAFEGEPVDPSWLEKQHAQTTPPAALKPRAAS